ncbi:MAG: hypothetical protein LCH56_10775 [Proteobacteria bacterium]|nr:hypothetical protein [Pseudomonadota bacterium]
MKRRAPKFARAPQAISRRAHRPGVGQNRESRGAELSHILDNGTSSPERKPETRAVHEFDDDLVR